MLRLVFLFVVISSGHNSDAMQRIRSKLFIRWIRRVKLACSHVPIPAALLYGRHNGFLCIESR